MGWFTRLGGGGGGGGGTGLQTLSSISNASCQKAAFIIKAILYVDTSISSTYALHMYKLTAMTIVSIPVPKIVSTILGTGMRIVDGCVSEFKFKSCG